MTTRNNVKPSHFDEVPANNLRNVLLKLLAGLLALAAVGVVGYAALTIPTKYYSDPNTTRSLLFSVIGKRAVSILRFESPADQKFRDTSAKISEICAKDSDPRSCEIGKWEKNLAIVTQPDAPADFKGAAERIRARLAELKG